MIAVSSGSTGTPAFWPRFVTDELAIAVRFEQVFHDSFHADSRLTLTVVCFALGTWVGGMYTAACCRHLATKGTLLFSGDNGIPLVRYHISDAGGLVDYPAMLRFLKGGNSIRSRHSNREMAARSVPCPSRSCSGARTS